jgi:hypothetical protein
MSPLSVSYRMIHCVMHQLRNRKVNEKHLVIMVDYFILKRSFLINDKIYFCMFDVIMVFYISLPSSPNINLLKTKQNLLHIRNQSVPRCKPFPPWL